MKTKASSPGRVLIVDDEVDARAILTHILEKEGNRVVAAEDGRQAMRMIQSADGKLDLVVLDVVMPDLDGMEVLRRIRELDENLPVVLLTGFADIAQSVDAMRHGAYDYLAKPFDNHELAAVVRRALAKSRSRKRDMGAEEVREHWSLFESMGTSDAVAQVVGDVHRVAESDFSVLILGETGVGKELVAESIHRASLRRSAPFVTVDCGAIPEPLLESEMFGHERGAFTGATHRHTGKFEAACGGTLFLDEIANAPLSSQAKLLRAIQERTICRVGGGDPVDVDFRLLAATNRDLRAMVDDGTFREDLYYRLCDFTIALPPLRERRHDLPHLVHRFLRLASDELARPVPPVSDEAMVAMLTYDWPGNVRQLRSVVRRAALMAAEEITAADLDIDLTAAPETASLPASWEAAWQSASFKEIVQQSVLEVETRVLTEALRVTGGNKAKAARLLHMDYKTIHTKVKKFGIQTRKGDDDEKQVQARQKRQRA